jgi:hypothetical protein
VKNASPPHQLGNVVCFLDEMRNELVYAGLNHLDAQADQRGSEPMKLHTPSNTVFFISCMLVAVVIVGRFFPTIPMPVLEVFVRSPEMQFRMLMIAWLTLFGGLIFNY